MSYLYFSLILIFALFTLWLLINLSSQLIHFRESRKKSNSARVDFILLELREKCKALGIDNPEGLTIAQIHELLRQHIN